MHITNVPRYVQVNKFMLGLRKLFEGFLNVFQVRVFDKNTTGQFW